MIEGFGIQTLVLENGFSKTAIYVYMMRKMGVVYVLQNL